MNTQTVSVAPFWPQLILLRATVLTYLVGTLLGLDRWLRALLDGRHYWVYQIVYLPALVVLFYALSRRVRSTSLVQLLFCGVGAGYMAGLAAYFVLPIVSIVVWHKLLPFFTDSKGIWELVTFPLLSMAWLLGGGLAWFFWVLKRQGRQRSKLILSSVLVATVCWALGAGLHP
jgi:hypothetical protein